MNLEISSFRTHNAAGQGDVYDIVRAVDDAIKNRMDILNMSFSYMAPVNTNTIEPLEVAIRNAEANEILVLAAAGNSAYDNDQGNYSYYPASFTGPNIISIASVNCSSDLSAFSNIGQISVDIATLGEEVVSPVQNGNFHAKSGTSQATAFATAVASMLASNLNQMDYAKIKCAMLSSVSPVGALNQLVLTGGVIHAGDAYDFLINSSDCTIVFKNDSSSETLDILENIAVFPNPGQKEFNISFESIDNSPVTLEFFDISGRRIDHIVKTFPTGPQQFIWHADNTYNSTGLILLKLIQNDKIAYSKFYRFP